MKTAMQDLIDDLKKLKRDSKENDSTGTFEIGLNFAIARAERRLEKEKEQIMEAWYNGFDELRPFVDHSEEYYNKTYNQNDQI